MSWFRLFIGILITLVVYFTPNFIDQDGKVSTFYYILVMSLFLLQQVINFVLNMFLINNILIVFCCCTVNNVFDVCSCNGIFCSY